MAIAKTVVSILGIGALLAATPVMAQSSASRLSLSNAAGAKMATPSVKKGKNFSETMIGVFVAVAVGIGAVVIATNDGDGNGLPTSP